MVRNNPLGPGRRRTQGHVYVEGRDSIFRREIPVTEVTLKGLEVLEDISPW